MNVIDLSDWNDHINWSHMIDEGVEGVIVKISEGRTLSELHGKHIAGASARGLPWGVYCYTHAQTTARAEEEAAVVIEALDALGYGAPPLGIWIDVEAPEIIGQDREDVTAICSAFISACNTAGYSAGIYASLSTLTDCINVNDMSTAEIIEIQGEIIRRQAVIIKAMALQLDAVEAWETEIKLIDALKEKLESET